MLSDAQSQEDTFVGPEAEYGCPQEYPVGYRCNCNIHVLIQVSGKS